MTENAIRAAFTGQRPFPLDEFRVIGVDVDPSAYDARPGTPSAIDDAIERIGSEMSWAASGRGPLGAVVEPHRH